MTDEQILALYEWRIGDCFRCARTSLPTTRMAEIGTAAGARHPIRGCKKCVLALEMERRHDAARRGTTYVPGGVGQPGV
jgi:hypothetical protein